MWFFSKKKQKKKDEVSTYADQNRLKDMSYLQQVHCTALSKGWYQYDILLAANIYGWSYMVDTAEYINQVDLQGVNTLVINPEEVELIDEYKAADCSVKQIKSLQKEQMSLAIGGISQKLECLLKITWFNQTRVLRLVCLHSDQETVMKYTETLVRRSFGTPDEMKLGQPVPEEKV